MKNTPGILSVLILPFLLGACTANSEKSPTGDSSGFSVYKLFITTRQTSTDGKIVTVTDSTIFGAANDSLAYLNAIQKYERCLKDWNGTAGKNGIEPVAFELTTENNEDVALKLTPSQKVNIEMAIRATVQSEKKVVDDAAEKGRSNDANNAASKNTLDSVLIRNPAGDSTKNLRRKRSSGTYAPI